MPSQNRFRHQRYLSDSCGDWELIRPDVPPEVGSDVFRQQMAVAGQSLAQAGVGTIYLVHGTLAGTDVSGLIGELGRVSPEWADQLRELEKSMVDSLVGDWGNYDDEFAETLAAGINANLDNPIVVRRYHWTSENHHTGRADGAIRLIAELRRLQQQQLAHASTRRVMLWGHSHAGNVFALLTNLLGGSPAGRQGFFRAARSFYRRPGGSKIDLPAWDEVRQWLQPTGNPLHGTPLDIVTFGTPVRYGWESGGYDRLLHFVNHRPTKDCATHRVPFPPSLEQLVSAESGDLFQQLFIAGTNFPPNLLAWRSWLAERRLSKLFQSSVRRRDLWERWKVGVRVPEDGKTLLVEYAAGDEETGRALIGHAVYTKRRWLPFHLQMIISHFYDSRDRIGTLVENSHD